MTRKEVIGMMAAGVLTTLQAADVLGVSPRHMRRLRYRLAVFGQAGLMDGPGLSRKKLVHELLDDSLGVSFRGKLIARFDRQGPGFPPSPEPHDTRTSLTAH